MRKLRKFRPIAITWNGMIAGDFEADSGILGDAEGNMCFAGISPCWLQVWIEGRLDVSC